MPTQKGFVLIPIIIVVVLLLVFAVVFFKPFSNRSSTFVGETFQKAPSDLIDGHPHECQKRMGFDNWRTDQSFSVDPQDSKLMYVAVEYKGVYKSQDGGVTWAKKNQGLRGYPSQGNPQVPCQEQHPLLVVDPSNSNRLLLTSPSSAGTLKDMNSENAGLYESLDAGESWHQLFSEAMNVWTYTAFAFDPTNTKTIYVGTSAMPANYDGADPNKIFVTKGVVYKTKDGGKTWKELPTGLVPYLRSWKLFINPKDSNHLFLATMATPPNRGGGKIQSEQLGILETKDGGETWTQLESLPKADRAIMASDIAPQNFNNIFISVSRSNEEEIKYYSVDAGRTFNEVATAVNMFKFDPHDPQGLRLLGYSLYASPPFIFESLDGGKTWHTYSSIPKEVTNELRISNIVWDPKNKNIVYLNGDEGRVWKSDDNGKNWQLILSLENLK